jgi:uncharacterized ubiquitin-like protein YukD
MRINIFSAVIRPRTFYFDLEIPDGATVKSTIDNIWDEHKEDLGVKKIHVFLRHLVLCYATFVG